MKHLHIDCSFVEDVHLRVCAHLITSFIFRAVRVGHVIYPKCLKGCLVCVICNSYSFHSFIFKFVRYDCSHIEHVYPIFCAHLVIFWSVELRQYYVYTIF